MKKIAIAIQQNRFSFYTIFSGVLFSLVFYMYFINSAVRSTMLRNQMESKISSLEFNLSELETDYIKTVNGISLELAPSLGLKESKNKIFISRNLSALLSPKPLSLNKQ